MISKYVDEMHSLGLVPKNMAFSYNVSPHETTGETPYFLVYDRDPVMSIDLALRARNSTNTETSMLSCQLYRVKVVSYPLYER